MSTHNRVPRYRLHKQSGQAVVTLPDGTGRRRDVYLGKFGSAISRKEYARVIREWEASGRVLVQAVAGGSLTINELLLAYWKHAEGRYGTSWDGSPSTELDCIKSALGPLGELYGHTSVGDFGPLALAAVQQQMIGRRTPRGKPWSLNTINKSLGRIKAVFKWAKNQQLIPASVYEGVKDVPGLQSGRTQARETERVKPVPAAFVEAVQPFLSAEVWAMIELQLLAGMRPGEVVIMRAIDLDTSGKVWLYRPGSDRPHGRHKTAWRGHDRIIAIGPKAQEVVKPFLQPNLHAYLFSPRERMETFYEVHKKKERDGKRPARQRTRKRPWGEHYTPGTYRNAIQRACVQAGVPRWHPNQLRHTKATEIRKEAGLDAARAVLGHRSPTITEIYAEIDLGKAAEVMERLG